MSIPIVGQVINLVSSGLTTIFKHKSTKIQAELQKRGMELDEKKLEVMLEVTEIEFQKYVLENSLQIDKDFRNFVTEYEGAAKDVHPYVQILRAIVRPTITLWAVGIISYLMFADPTKIMLVAENMKLIPEKLWDIFFIVFAFWFGGRAVQHIIDKYTKGRVQEKKEVAKGDVNVAIEETNRVRAQTEATRNEEEPATHFTEEEVSRAMPRSKRFSRGPKRR